MMLTMELGDEAYEYVLAGSRRFVRRKLVLAPPGPGQVLLELIRGAICGCDVERWIRGDPPTESERVIGHRGMFKVLDIGRDVTTVDAGDTVVAVADARTFYATNTITTGTRCRLIEPWVAGEFLEPLADAHLAWIQAKRKAEALLHDDMGIPSVLVAGGGSLSLGMIAAAVDDGEDVIAVGISQPARMQDEWLRLADDYGAAHVLDVMAFGGVDELVAAVLDLTGGQLPPIGFAGIDSGVGPETLARLVRPSGVSTIVGWHPADDDPRTPELKLAALDAAIAAFRREQFDPGVLIGSQYPLAELQDAFAAVEAGLIDGSVRLVP
jgi:threonine dehydrogenase-like Zn-dependent dehydrogenase